jgi:hypothetical protein
MTLDPAPLTWLESLSNNSIDSWEGLKKVFIDNFQGAIAHASVTVRVFVMLDIYFVSVKYMFVKCKACVCLCETFENLNVQIKRVFL